VTLQDFADAIIQMRVRGAPLIGATAAYGMALAMRISPSDAHMTQAWEFLHNTRPTAINLRWALNRCQTALLPLPEVDRTASVLDIKRDLAPTFDFP
jgi:methylthioribose-1-phosphate isomerase